MRIISFSFKIFMPIFGITAKFVSNASKLINHYNISIFVNSKNHVLLAIDTYKNLLLISTIN